MLLAAVSRWRNDSGPSGAARMRVVSPDWPHPPVEWSETKHTSMENQNPRTGSSSPVVWGDWLFVYARASRSGASGLPTLHDP